MRTVQLPQGYDEVDRTIVAALAGDGRLSIPALAEQVGISRATAYARFGRLVEEGIIGGFQAVVTPAHRGLTVAALVLMKVDQAHWEGTLQRLVQVEGVEWVGLAGASFDFVALVRAIDLAEMRDVILERLRAVPGLTSTETAIIFEETGGVS
jgi:DNA-binding Lrp family transcriptional regulator